MFNHNDFDIISSLRNHGVTTPEIPTRSAISRQHYLEKKLACLRAEENQRRRLETERQTRFASTLFARIVSAVRHLFERPVFHGRTTGL